MTFRRSFSLLLFTSFLHAAAVDAQTFVGEPTTACCDGTAFSNHSCDGCHDAATTWFDGHCGRRNDCSNGAGTLFRWSADPRVTGGPDLDAPLVTDRPDFTEASSTVGRGVLQMEIGYTYTRNDDAGVREQGETYPEVLLRYGMLADWLEFRLGYTYGEGRISDAAFPSAAAAGGGGSVASRGSEDLYLGFKLGLTPQVGVLPEMALIPQMTVPTGSSDLTSGEVLAGLNWIYGWELNDWLSTAGSTQFNRALDGQTEDAFTQWAQSWTIAYGLTDRWGAYTEYFGLYPSGADTEVPVHFFNGGFTYLVNNDVLWDIRAGTGLNDAAADYFVGTGVSIRWH